MVPPAVALAIIDENAAPANPTAKRNEPTGPARGSKTFASCPMDDASLLVRPNTAGCDDDHQGGHDARRDDAGNGIGDRGLAVLVTVSTLAHEMP